MLSTLLFLAGDDSDDRGFVIECIKAIFDGMAKVDIKGLGAVICVCAIVAGFTAFGISWVQLKQMATRDAKAHR